MNLNDGLGMQGFFKATKRYTDGREEVHCQDKNIITHTTRQNLIKSVYSQVESDPVEDIVVGIGGTVDPEGRFPKSPSRFTTSLSSQILVLNETTFTLPDDVSVTFLADVRAPELNEYLISEAGLVTKSGKLFAYKTFPGIPKTDAFSVHLEWTIVYV